MIFVPEILQLTRPFMTLCWSPRKVLSCFLRILPWKAKVIWDFHLERTLAYQKSNKLHKKCLTFAQKKGKRCLADRLFGRWQSMGKCTLVKFPFLSTLFQCIFRHFFWWLWSLFADFLLFHRKVFTKCWLFFAPKVFGRLYFDYWDAALSIGSIFKRTTILWRFCKFFEQNVQLSNSGYRAPISTKKGIRKCVAFEISTRNKKYSFELTVKMVSWTGQMILPSSLHRLCPSSSLSHEIVHRLVHLEKKKKKRSYHQITLSSK